MGLVEGEKENQRHETKNYLLLKIKFSHYLTRQWETPIKDSPPKIDYALPYSSVVLLTAYQQFIDFSDLRAE